MQLSNSLNKKCPCGATQKSQVDECAYVNCVALEQACIDVKNMNIRFVQLIVQSKASDDYRGFVQFRVVEDCAEYEPGLYEMRGSWAPNPVEAAQIAWEQYCDPHTRHFNCEWIGE
jgi:hypothetical protein